MPVASVGKAIAALQAAGHRLESDGEGLWRIDGGGDITSAALIAFARRLMRQGARQAAKPDRVPSPPDA